MTHRELDPDSNFYDWAAVELQRYMRLMGVTKTEVGRIIGRQMSIVGKLERGEALMQIEHALALDKAWDTGGLFARIIRYAKKEHHDEWAEESDRLVSTATQIRVWSFGWVPALLQTPAYAEALFRSVKVVDVGAALKRRLMLQRAALDRPGTPYIRALIDLSALELPLGSSDAQREQLDHLIQTAEQHSVRIVTPRAGGHIGRDGSFVIYNEPGGRVSPYAVTLGPGRLVRDTDDVRMFERSFDTIADVALTAQDSLSELRRVRERLG